MIRICLLLALVTQFALGQNRQGPEKIKALKTAHITQELDLTPSEAEAFWPVYNQFQEQVEAIRREERSELATLRNKGFDKLTNEEANRLLDRMIELKSREYSIQKEQITALRKVISPMKVLRLKKAEEEFKRMLLNRFRERRGRQ